MMTHRIFRVFLALAFLAIGLTGCSDPRVKTIRQKRKANIQRVVAAWELRESRSEPNLKRTTAYLKEQLQARPKSIDRALIASTP